MKRARSRSATWLVVFGVVTLAGLTGARAQRTSRARVPRTVNAAEQTPSASAPEVPEVEAPPPIEDETTATEPVVDPDTRPMTALHRNVVMTYPLAWVGRAFAVAYERALPDARFSLLARMSFAAPAGGDYASRHVGFSLESRFYVLGRGAFTRWAAPAPVGLYVGARLGITHFTLRDARTERQVGTSSRIGFEGSTGYRFVAWERVEFTPYVGALFYSDIVDGLVISFRPTMTFGFTIGGMF